MRPGTFVGLNNYYKILFDTEARIHASFWASLKITFLYVVGACVGKFIVGMVSALILNAHIRARHFWRVAAVPALGDSRRSWRPTPGSGSTTTSTASRTPC